MRPIGVRGQQGGDSHGCICGWEGYGRLLTCLFYNVGCKQHNVVGVTKMGNIVSRAGIEITPLHVGPWYEQLHHLGSLMSPCYPCIPVYAAPCFRGQYRLLQSSPWNCKSLNAQNYILTDKDHAHMHRVYSTTIQGRG